VCERGAERGNFSLSLPPQLKAKKGRKKGREKRDQEMEDDRVLVDVGIAAEIEESRISQNAVRQPKRRFVGRRTAEATAKAAPPSSSSIEDSGAIQGIYLPVYHALLLFECCY
jgi:hypothetical protein